MIHTARAAAGNTVTADIAAYMQGLGANAAEAARAIALLSAEQRDNAIRSAAGAIRERASVIIAANEKDMAAGEEKGLSAAMLDRLKLNEARIEAMAAGLEAVAAQPDPLAGILEDREVAHNGLRIRRVPVPIGVIGVIYESRPNVTADAAALCVKAGNAVILRGGSESLYSSSAIHAAFAEGIAAEGVTPHAAQYIATPDRAAVGELLRMSDTVDLIIPRGGHGLCKRVRDESRVPTLLHLDGLCHTYLHASADVEKAVAVTVNAKMRRTGICGATETILVDKKAAEKLLPPVCAALREKGCAIRADAYCLPFCGEGAQAASPEDFDTEYLDAIVSIAAVDNVTDAAAFINKHGSGHTDAIIAEDGDAAELFLRGVDSAIVMHNASTQFADGGEFGMGAEIGIATGRMHARGPVGAAQLTTYKYLVNGNGATRP